MTDRCELAQRRKAKGGFLGAADRSHDVFRAAHGFAQRVLCGGRMRLASAAIWNARTIADGPDAGKIGHFQRLVDDNAALLLPNWQALPDTGRLHTRRPD